MLVAVAAAHRHKGHKKPASKDCSTFSFAPTNTFGTFRIGDYCYVQNPSGATWANAQTKCETIKNDKYTGSLGVVRDPEALAAMQTLLPEAWTQKQGSPNNNGYQWWVGGENGFDWLNDGKDGEAGDVPINAFWGTGQPAADPRGVQCVAIGEEGGVFGLTGWGCTAQQWASVCEIYDP